MSYPGEERISKHYREKAIQAPDPRRFAVYLVRAAAHSMSEYRFSSIGPAYDVFEDMVAERDRASIWTKKGKDVPGEQWIFRPHIMPGAAWIEAAMLEGDTPHVSALYLSQPQQLYVASRGQAIYNREGAYARQSLATDQAPWGVFYHKDRIDYCTLRGKHLHHERQVEQCILSWQLSQLAVGRRSFVVSTHQESLEEVAAGALLVANAGGSVTNHKNEFWLEADDRQVFVASSQPEIHMQLIRQKTK